MRCALACLVLAVALLPKGTAVADQHDGRLDALFSQLRSADDEREAARVERQIWALWFESADKSVEEQLSRGVEAMNRRSYEAALRAFDAVIAARAGFAEGWNRRATLFYLMGDLDASVADIRRTLELEPRHFGALSGLALIREAQGRPFEALEALEKVMQIHPRMPQLALRVEQLTAQLGEPI
jgi:tetratricopeptide (TPR) repeat protein